MWYDFALFGLICSRGFVGRALGTRAATPAGITECGWGVDDGEYGRIAVLHGTWHMVVLIGSIEENGWSAPSLWLAG